MKISAAKFALDKRVLPGLSFTQKLAPLWRNRVGIFSQTQSEPAAFSLLLTQYYTRVGGVYPVGCLAEELN
jgi:hypothetical protein